MDENLKNEIAALGRTFGASRITLFGSRARGDHRERSDIDIAVFGLPSQHEDAFLNGIDNLPTLLNFDIVFVAPYTSAELLNNIKKDGVILMDKAQEKFEKFNRAVIRLQEVLADYDHYQIESLKDAIIQRFSFCSELAWKTTREVLIDQGYTEANTPKAVMRQAYEAGYVSDGSAWIKLLNSRNLVAHVYNEETAQEIFDQIRLCFLPLMQQLLVALKNAL